MQRVLGRQDDPFIQAQTDATAQRIPVTRVPKHSALHEFAQEGKFIDLGKSIAIGACTARGR